MRTKKNEGIGKGMGSSRIVKFDFPNPRRNLPEKTAMKRGEANFLGAFERTFTEQHTRPGIGSRQFALSGYGIADFVWISSLLMEMPLEEDSVKADIAKSLEKETITAFEMKLYDWKRALQQAYRYSYFADQTIVVLPASCRRRVESAKATFEKLNVGLWLLDAGQKQIEEMVTPQPAKAKNQQVRKKAVGLFIRKLKLRPVCE